MSDLKRCRPRTCTMFQILDWKFMIALVPQQRWNYRADDGGCVVSRDCVSIRLTAEEFAKYFVEAEKKGGGVDEVD